MLRQITQLLKRATGFVVLIEHDSVVSSSTVICFEFNVLMYLSQSKI